MVKKLDIHNVRLADFGMVFAVYLMNRDKNVSTFKPFNISRVFNLSLQN